MKQLFLSWEDRSFLFSMEFYASPVYASREELAGLTPFLIITAQKDMLSEEADL